MLLIGSVTVAIACAIEFAESTQHWQQNGHLSKNSNQVTKIHHKLLHTICSN